MKQIFASFGADLSRATRLLWNVDRKTTIINFLLQALQAFLPVLSLYFMKALLEALTAGRAGFETAVPLIAGFGAVQFISALVGQYATYITSIYQEKLTDYLSTEVLVKAVEVDYEYYETPSYHDTLHLAQQQAATRVSQLFNNFNSIILNTFSLFFLIAYFFSLQSLFALFFMLLSIPLAVVKWYSGYESVKLARKFAPEERETGYIHSILTSVHTAKEVRVFGFGRFFIDRFRKMRFHILREKRRLSLKYTGYSLAAEGLEIIVIAIVLGILAKDTWEKTITIGAFVIYIQGFQRLQSTSKSFLQSVLQLFQQRLFLRDIFNFFDLETGSSESGDRQFPTDNQALSVANLSFSYPETKRPVLQNISITCEPGKIVAIVGENGCGKSTLVKLLARLYAIQEGSIRFGEIPINDIDIADYRKNSVFIFQDFEKYFFTIEENIAIGESNFNSDAVAESAKLSGAHPFIEKLGNGYKTRMGRLFRGSEQLSGGQWQKVALSRLFYRNPALVVLDEPSSALDAQSEYELYENIKKHMGNKMVILITHRLYNLKIADYIYLMKDGSVAEEGTLNDLVNRGGRFSSMFAAQDMKP